MKKLLMISALCAMLIGTNANADNVDNMLIRCDMYVKAMVFDDSGTRVSQFLQSKLAERGVTKSKQVSIRTQLRSIVKKVGASFTEEMDFYSNDCRKLGLM
jgi:hypothetical protein